MFKPLKTKTVETTSLKVGDKIARDGFIFEVVKAERYINHAGSGYTLAANRCKLVGQYDQHPNMPAEWTTDWTEQGNSLSRSALVLAD